MKGKSRGMRGFIGSQDGGGVLELCFREPRVFFSGVSFPPDKVFAIGGRTTVFENLFNFIFLFSIDKVRGWSWEISSMSFVLIVRR